MSNLHDTHGILLKATSDVIPVHKVDEWFTENSHLFLPKNSRFVRVEFSSHGDTLWFLYQPLRENCWTCESEDNTEGYCDGHNDEFGWSEMIDFTRVNVWG